MTEFPPESIVPTPEQLRGITHPVRVRLLGLLRMDGPQTSADLARATGLNTGATSYHLRQLAQHGFIEDAPGLGSGRERHWRAKHRGTRMDAPADGPEATASLDDRAAFQQTVVSWAGGQLQAAQDEWTELPAAWRVATTFEDHLLRLSAEQAAVALTRLQALVEEISSAYPYDSDRAGGAQDSENTAEERVHGELWEIHLMAFPVPGRLPHREEQS